MQRHPWLPLAIMLVVSCNDQTFDDPLLLNPAVSSTSLHGAAVTRMPAGGTGAAAHVPGFATSTVLATSKLYWDPTKAAFRAGADDADYWSGANVGQMSTATGFNTLASGQFSTALGYSTAATGTSAIALGQLVNADKDGAFIWGDNSTGTAHSAPADNSFTVRASGGVNLYTSSTLGTGCSLAAGSGTWACTSDENAKENFRAENGESVLGAIVKLPVLSWNFKTEDTSVRHIGPTAQDFYRAFGLGHDSKHINLVDIDGVNLLAVQALERRTRDLQVENAGLRGRIAGLEAVVQRLEAAMAGRQQ